MQLQVWELRRPKGGEDRQTKDSPAQQCEEQTGKGMPEHSRPGGKTKRSQGPLGTLKLSMMNKNVRRNNVEKHYWEPPITLLGTF